MKQPHALFLFLFFCTQSYSQKITIDEKVVNGYIETAGEYYATNEFENSLKYSKIALQHALRLKNDYLIAQSYNSFAVIFDEFGQIDRALYFYEKSLKYASKIQNDTLLSWVNNNIGGTYYFNKVNIKKGIEHYEKSIFYAEKVKDSLQICYSKLNLANAYFADGNFKLGDKYLNQVENYVLKGSDFEIQFYFFDAKGVYYSNIGENEKALASFEKARKISIKKLDNRALIPNLYHNLGEHYERNNQKEISRFYFKESERVEDSIYSKTSPILLEQSAVKIKLNEYVDQLEQLEFATELETKKAAENKIVNILIAIIVSILLVFIYSLVRSNINRKRINEKLVRVNEKLNKAKILAEENSKIKSQFVSTVSHELRTPLYGVVGITQMIIDEENKEIDRNQLKSLNFSASYLLALVNDLLQISAIEEKKIELNENSFNLKDTINVIKNALVFFAENNNNKVVIEHDENIPNSLIGDDLRLSQILMNLIGNALKFTTNGRVIISTQLIKSLENKSIIRFVVKDNGIGISEENQKLIFEKFIQLNRKKSDYQGTGLGLAIVKRLIELFNSDIKMKSALNEGTEFSFDIEFKSDKIAQSEMVLQPNSIQIDTKDLNILIVEDNKINQIVTKKILEKNNYQCVIVENGHDAIKIVQEIKFDVILMDLNMPLIDGFETTKIIRELGFTIPIIALTAFESKEVEVQAAEVGIDDIVMKPFEPTVLYKVIQTEIGKRTKSEVL